MKKLTSTQIILIIIGSFLTLNALIFIIFFATRDNNPSKEELLLQEQIEELRDELNDERSTIDLDIENPSLEDLTNQEILERNAIQREVQETNDKIKAFEKQKAEEAQRKLEEAKAKAKAEAKKRAEELERQRQEAENNRPPVVIPVPTPVQPEPTPAPSPNPPSNNSGSTLKIKTNYGSPLNLREGTSTNTKVLNSIPNGTGNIDYSQSEQVNGHTWYKIEYEGKEGWVRGDYVQKEQ